jgi:heavy metal sensor kinase
LLAVRRSLLEAVDEQLSFRTRGLASVVRSEMRADSDRHLRRELSEYAAAAPEGGLLQVLDESGAQILPAGDATQSLLPLPVKAGRTAERATAMFQRIPYRLATEFVTIANRRFRVSAATSLEPELVVLGRLRTELLWSVPALLLLSSFAGYWVSRRALAPVGQIAAAARSISSENLSRRLDMPATLDEIHDLAQTFNGMLTRLETAFGSLKQFTADASHELRSPVALILAEAEIALRRERPVEAYREALRKIMLEAQSTASLVEDLLVLARGDAAKSTPPAGPVDLAAVVRDVMTSMSDAATARNIGLHASGSASSLHVAGRPAQLRRLVVALVDNALKFTPSGGSVTILHGLEQGAPFLAVQDTGIGISQDDLPRIFERFYRADPSRIRTGGHGLGLAIARQISADHGAVVEVQSTLGRGSTFRVRFPAKA